VGDLFKAHFKYFELALQVLDVHGETICMQLSDSLTSITIIPSYLSYQLIHSMPLSDSLTSITIIITLSLLHYCRLMYILKLHDDVMQIQLHEELPPNVEYCAACILDIQQCPLFGGSKCTSIVTSCLFLGGVSFSEGPF
jgi:hypothetical protein